MRMERIEYGRTHVEPVCVCVRVRESVRCVPHRLGSVRWRCERDTRAPSWRLLSCVCAKKKLGRYSGALALVLVPRYSILHTTLHYPAAPAVHY